MSEKRVKAAAVGVVLALVAGTVAGGIWLSSRSDTDDPAQDIDMAQVVKDWDSAAPTSRSETVSAAVASGRRSSEEDSIAEAPPGAPRSVALKLSGQEWRRLRDYARILGEASVCGVDMGGEVAAVGSWMDRKFPPGTEGQGDLLLYFARVSEASARRIAAGDAGRDCTSVADSVRSARWPDR